MEPSLVVFLLTYVISTNTKPHLIFHSIKLTLINYEYIFIKKKKMIYYLKSQ